MEHKPENPPCDEPSCTVCNSSRGNMTFLKQQQAKARIGGNHYLDLKADSIIYQPEDLDTLIAQLIKDTTARVREVLGEEVKMEKRREAKPLSIKL